jgi:exopolysaccharide biosynthesis polyprenyl glycosylphosphotransferase
MQNVHRKIAIQIQALLDMPVMTACFFLAAFVNNRQAGSVSFTSFLSMRFTVIDFIIFAVFLLVWRTIFSLFGLYRSKRLTSIDREATDVLKATFAGSLVFLIMGRMFRVSFLTPESIALFWAASACGTLMVRLPVRCILRTLRLRGRNLSHLLMVGTNRRAVEYAKNITAKPELGYVIVGFVENGWSTNPHFRQSGFKVVTDFKKFPDFISTHVVDEVMVCLPIKSHYEQSSRIVRACEQQGIIVRFLSDLFDLNLATATAETVDNTSVITLRTGAMQGWPLLIKRVMDILFSTTMFLFALPLFALIAILIKLTSQGPVFFLQDRIGLNKRKFRLYKFRTMVVNAEKMIKDLEHLNELTGPVFKIKNDPRITSIGKYLRKASIDELPQLINVLKGDMSLVGPRPMAVRDFELFDEDWLRRRFSVRPGITCLWQVRGRNSIPFDKWLQFDMEYIDNWSLLLDFKILAQTVPAVLKGAGAT